MPSRSSRPSSPRQFSRTRTSRSRKTARRARARAPCGPRCRSRGPSARPCRSGSTSATRSPPRSVRGPRSGRPRARRSPRPRPRPRAEAPRGCGAGPARGSARRGGPRSAGRCGPPAGRAAGPRGRAPRAARRGPSIPVPRFAEIGKTSSTTSSSPTSASTSVSSGGPSRSILLTAQITGAPDPAVSRWPAMKRSPGPTPCSALTTNSTASASSSSCSTRRCMRSVSTSRGRWTPGRSTSTSCQAPARSRGDAAARPAGGLRTVGDDRHLRADDRVDERRLADVRASREADEAGASPGGLSPAWHTYAVSDSGGAEGGLASVFIDPIR